VANNRVVFDGLAQLRADLLSLPDDLAQEAAVIVDDTTEVTASSLRQAYPRGETGKLRDGVRAEMKREQFGVVGTVHSTSPHAHLWEFGTQLRRTREGWNRGRMPSRDREGLVSIAARNRRQMNGQLVELVRNAGFDVTGDPNG
jgi:hypothetical protein